MTASRMGDLNIWIGDLEDAQTFDGNIICVLEERPEKEPEHALHIPILDVVWEYNKDDERHSGYIKKAFPSQLNLVSDLINKNKHDKLLVHCGSGIERSPLAVTWYLYKEKSMSIENAYKVVKKYRPQTIEHLEWLNSWDSKYKQHG